MDIRFVAKQYIDAGWAVVPLVKGEKRAATSWRTKAYGPNDFGPDDGIALKCGEPSGWRVDVDLDCLEAVEAAKALLPATGLIHGRPGKPFSHYWFICKDIKTTQFTDTKANSSSMLVEIRSSGGYTAVPPSVHPSGEHLHWEQERPPFTIEPGVLYDSVRDVALAALLAKHWNEYGHHAIGPLAGFLTMAGVVEAVRVIVTAARVAGASSDLVRDAEAFAETTVAKLRAGQKVTGGPKLAEHLPEAMIEKMRGWCKMADTDAIEEMNAKHFWVRIGKFDAIGREDTASGQVVFQRVTSLYSEYANRKIVTGQDDKGKPQIEPLFKAWLESKTRRSYREVAFAPPPVKLDERDYNLWTGFAVQPARGDCSLYLDHLRHVICGGNDEYYEYLLKWMALAVQAPGIAPGVAIVMRGDIGAGKGTVVRPFEKFFGHHYVQLDKVEQLTGRFNAAVSGKVIVFADEAFWAGDKRDLGPLKRMITEPTLAIEYKNLDIMSERNCIHLFMATNNEWSVPAGPLERRFFPVKVTSDHIRDRPYFSALNEQMRQGGHEALLDMLLAYPTSPDEVRNVPMTEELRVQQNQSLSAEEKWWQECLTEGKIVGGNIGWGAWVPGDDMYTAYKTWLREYNGRLLDRLEFTRRMGVFFCPDGKTLPKRIKGQLERCWPLRDLDDARSFFDSKCGTTHDWSGAQSASPAAPGNPF